MSVWASVTIIGSGLIGDSYDVVAAYLSKFGGTVDIGGFVRGTAIVDGDADFVMEPLNGRDPVELSRSLVKSGRFTTLEYALEIDGAIRYFNIDAHYDDRLVIMVTGNRVVLHVKVTDFSWYYVNVVSRFSIAVDNVCCVEFSDIY